MGCFGVCATGWGPTRYSSSNKTLVCSAVLSSEDPGYLGHGSGRGSGSIRSSDELRMTRWLDIHAEDKLTLHRCRTGYATFASTNA